MIKLKVCKGRKLMREEPDNGNSGLLDEDPAMDYVLLKEMDKEDKQPRKKGGCFTLILFLSVPAAACYSLLDMIE